MGVERRKNDNVSVMPTFDPHPNLPPARGKGLVWWRFTCFQSSYIYG